MFVQRKIGRTSNSTVKIAGISMDKTMADKLMYILNDNTQHYPCFRLQFVVKTFRHTK